MAFTPPGPWVCSNMWKLLHWRSKEEEKGRDQGNVWRQKASQKQKEKFCMKLQQKQEEPALLRKTWSKKSWFMIFYIRAAERNTIFGGIGGDWSLTTHQREVSPVKNSRNYLTLSSSHLIFCSDPKIIKNYLTLLFSYSAQIKKFKLKIKKIL